MLSETDRSILDVERDWWRERAPKAAVVRERLGLSAASYHRLLNELIEQPGALAYDPMLVGRLRRLRDARRRARFAGLPRREL